MHSLALIVTMLVAAESPPAIRLARVPDAGLQPQLALDAKGTLHALWFKGDAMNGDLFYSSWPQASGGAQPSFAPALRVNHDDGDAIAVGNIRGAQLALGRGGRVHVAWMGSTNAKVKAPGKSAPMLYTRLDEKGAAFEPERNVIAQHPGLDGGGTLAADDQGHVYVAWHAPRAKNDDEEHRIVWVATSSDDGKTFADERPAWEQATGACGCCGMRAGCSGTTLAILYRAALRGSERDLYALVSTDFAKSFRGVRVDDWKANQCVGSTSSLAATASGPVAAWEDEGDVLFARVTPQPCALGKATRPPEKVGGARANRKHPSVAVNGGGDVLLAWTEGMGWERGGTLVWQLFDKSGKPVSDACGRQDGVPMWSLVAAAALPDGNFVVLY